MDISWLEEARIEALDQVGLNYVDLTKNGFEMPVVSLAVNYLSTLHHGDEVLLESFCLKRQGARWPWKTNFFKNGDFLVAESTVDLVLVKNDGKGFKLMRRIPEGIDKAISDLQNGCNI